MDSSLQTDNEKLNTLSEKLSNKSLPRTTFPGATVTAEHLLTPYTAYNASGNLITGTAKSYDDGVASARKRYAPLALQAGSTPVSASNYGTGLRMYPVRDFNYKQLGAYTYNLSDDITIKAVSEAQLQVEYTITNNHTDLPVEVFLIVRSIWSNVTEGTLPEPGTGTLPNKPSLTSSTRNYYERHLLPAGQSVRAIVTRDDLQSDFYNRYTWSWNIEGVNGA